MYCPFPVTFTDLILLFYLFRYLIDSRWFKQWKKYVGFDSWDLYNVGEHNLYPGPIDNSGLFSGNEC